jgi:hypothetical protein
MEEILQTKVIKLPIHSKTASHVELTTLWLVFVVRPLNLCIAFRLRLVYDIEQQESNQELLGVNIREVQD